MKKIYILAICFIITSCYWGRGDDDGAMRPIIVGAFSENFYQENKSIAIVDIDGVASPSVTDGNKRVFTFNIHDAQQEDFEGDEFVRSIVFEIDPSLESFSYSDEELTIINPYYEEICSCPPYNFIITEGIFSGIKVTESSWEISYNIILVNGDGQNIGNALPTRVFTLRE